MQNIEQLSDDLLISLFQNNRLDKEMKAVIISEIDRRELKQENKETQKVALSTKLKILFTGTKYQTEDTIYKLLQL